LPNSYSSPVGGDRKTLITKHADLTKDLEKLRAELAAYSEQDPVEMGKKAAETEQARLDADKFTDQILVMQGYLKNATGGGDVFLDTLRMLYGDEFDEEEQGLREL
jgi:phytoene dehydrogenase-like protein